jgi:anti-anti-sigma factor
MVISSRTPEGTPNDCPVCGAHLKIEPSTPAGDAPCPCCGHLLWFTREDGGDFQIIKPVGSRLSPEIFDQLFGSEPMQPSMRLILDLSDVQSFSSAVLGKLINLKKKLASVHGKLRLRGIHSDVREIFRVTHLDQVFELEGDGL